MDSTGSSLASHQVDPKLAEDIIREYGEVPDFSNENLIMCKNLYQMCFVRESPNQSKLYKELIEGKQHMLHNYSGTLDLTKRDDENAKELVLGDSGSGSTNQTFHMIDEDIVEELDGEI